MHVTYNRHCLAFSFLICLMVGLSASMWGFPVDASCTGIDKEQAWTIVKDKILEGNLENKIVYRHEDLFKTGQELKSWGNVYVVPADFEQAWLFFVDDQPDANWQHACRYIWVDTKNGKYETIKSSTPPDSMTGMLKLSPQTPQE